MPRPKNHKLTAKIKTVNYKIENPDGYLFQETIGDVCPGCGMTFGYTIQQFRKHIVKCPECAGKTILLDEYGGLKLCDTACHTREASQG